MSKQNQPLNQFPALTELYPLTGEQIASYQKNGHIYLQGVASGTEVNAYRPIIERIVQENTNKGPMAERGTYGKAFIQIANLWLRSEEIRRFVLAKRFAKIAADLMGVDGVWIYHDQALFKEPGGGHTPWHQDQVYWPVDTDDTITMWMPLVDIPIEVGSMTFASASHLLGSIYQLVISDESHTTLQQFIDNKGFDLTTYGGMTAGDATFHAGWTMHSSPNNPTDMMREVMTIIYVADGARLVEADTPSRKGSVDKYFPTVKPGEVIDLPVHPLVYSRRW